MASRILFKLAQLLATNTFTQLLQLVMSSGWTNNNAAIHLLPLQLVTEEQTYTVAVQAQML
jgi:hypothetical protein